MENDGPGVTEEQAGHVGERFLRGKGSHGSGLGLSIVQAITALHDGTLALSRPSAGGTRAVLRLPGVRVPPANAPPTASA